MVELLETAEVQRLRRIKQLGVTSLAFPGAEHTRFAHALGSAHIMKRLLRRLRDAYGDLPQSLRLTEDHAREFLQWSLSDDKKSGTLDDAAWARVYEVGCC